MAAKSDLDALLSNNDELSKLEIDLGDRMLFKVDAVEGFLKTRFIGMMDNNYLIAKLPKGGPMVRDKFFEGSTVLVRYLHQGSIFAFQSAIAGVVDHPDKLVFLSFPAIVSRQELRKEPRVGCHLKATIDSGEFNHTGAVLDISRSGCCFALRSSSRYKPTPHQTVNMNLVIDEMESPVAVKGDIRTVDNADSMTMLGIQFLDITSEGKDRVGRFINTLSQFAWAKKTVSHLGRS